MKTEKEKMIAGELYHANDNELTLSRNNSRIQLEKLNQPPIIHDENRTIQMRNLFGKLGTSVQIEGGFRCDYGFNIHIDDNVFINYDCIILDICPVHIGKRTLIAPRVGIYAATHPLDRETRASGLEYGAPISIGEDCWIGAHAVITPGVTLGDNVVVASGAVVTKSFESNVLVAGVPAKIIKRLDPQ